MKIIRAGAYEAFYDMPLQVDWMLTTRCNYRCTYCFHYGYGRATPPQLPFSTLEQLKNAVDNIASLNRPHYDIILVGGEPTIHPHMMDLIYMLRDTLQERLREVSIVSNGSRNEELYRKIADIAKSVNISMQISVHTDHVDMEHILELIELLANDVNLYIPLMFNPDKREEVHLIFDILCEYRKRFPFRMEVKTIRLPNCIDPRYTEDDLQWIQETIKYFHALERAVKVKVTKKSPTMMHMFHDIEIDGKRQLIETVNIDPNYTNGLADFSGMYCVANTANLRIEENGLCRGLICYEPPHTCNIYEKGSLKAARDNLIHAIQCKRKLCGCDNANYVPKFSSLEETINFIEVFNAKQQALFDAAR